METWQELKVTVKREGEELVSNLLIELGAQGVAIEDSMDYVGNVDRFGEIFPWGRAARRNRGDGLLPRKRLM